MCMCIVNTRWQSICCYDQMQDCDRFLPGYTSVYMLENNIVWDIRSYIIQ